MASESATPTVPDGQPTWCRVHSGGGCRLPHRLPDGTLGVIPTAVPAPYLRDTFTIDEHGRRIWLFPADGWSPGDAVEIGPLPADVVVLYEIPRDRLAFLAEVDPCLHP